MTPDDVLRHVGAGRGPDRAAGQRRAGDAARRDRGGTPTTSTRRAGAPDARAARSAVPPRRVRRSAAPRVVLPVARHPARASAPARSTSCRTTSARCARSCADRTTDPLVLAAASPPDRHGYFSLGRQRRLRRVVHRAGPLLPRGQPRRCPARSAATRSTSARSSGGPRPTTRSSRSPRRRRRAIDERIAAFVAERIPNGATIQTGIGSIPNAILSALSRPPRPRRAHRAALRRRDGPRRAGRRQRGRQAAQPHQDGRHVRPRHAAACTTSSTRTRRSSCGRCATSTTRGSSPRRTSFVSINATIAVDLLGQCASRDGRRRLLLVERRAGRLRPRRDVLPGRAGLRRAALHREGRRDLQDRRPARRRATSSPR